MVQWLPGTQANPAQVQHNIGRWANRVRRRQQHQRELEELKVAGEEVLSISALAISLIALLIVFGVTYYAWKILTSGREKH
jgi:membrane protein required for beta-lactamase induction